MTDQQNPVEAPAEKATTLTAPVWPRDIYGISSGLRREIARTAGRLNGDPNKMAVFMATLRAGAEWGHSRMEVQAKLKSANMERQYDRQDRALADNASTDFKNGDAETAAERAARQDHAGVGNRK
jgi:hypothetical protein